MWVNTIRVPPVRSYTMVPAIWPSTTASEERESGVTYLDLRFRRGAGAALALRRPGHALGLWKSVRTFQANLSSNVTGVRSARSIMTPRSGSGTASDNLTVRCR